MTPQHKTIKLHTLSWYVDTDTDYDPAYDTKIGWAICRAGEGKDSTVTGIKLRAGHYLLAVFVL